MSDETTHWQTVLTAIQSMIQNRATREMKSITIPGGKTVEYLEPNELIKWEAYYQSMVNQYKRKQSGKSAFRQHKVNFK